jgi:hypothetical protein
VGAGFKVIAFPWEEFEAAKGKIPILEAAISSITTRRQEINSATRIDAATWKPNFETQTANLIAVDNRKSFHSYDRQADLSNSKIKI